MSYQFVGATVPLTPALSPIKERERAAAPSEAACIAAKADCGPPLLGEGLGEGDRSALLPWKSRNLSGSWNFTFAALANRVTIGVRPKLGYTGYWDWCRK